MNRTIVDPWIVSQDDTPCQVDEQLVHASEVVHRSQATIKNLIDEIKATSWPGLENLLLNKLARSMKEAEVYLSSVLESLEKAKKQVQILENLEADRDRQRRGIDRSLHHDELMDMITKSA